MKFYTKPILRYCYRYLLLMILVGLPTYFVVLSIFDDGFVQPQDKPLVASFFLVLMVCGCVLVHIGFWEKCFATVIVTDGDIRWKCPFRKTRILPMEKCRFSGVESEESYNGLPYLHIYVSCEPYPQKFKNRINRLKCSDRFIKFWYSEELCRVLERTLPVESRGSLTAYRIRSKRG